MDRSLFLFTFAASVLAGIGAQEFFKKIKNNQKLAYIALVSLLLLNLFVFGFHYTSPKGMSADLHPYEVLENNNIYQHIIKDKSLFRIQNYEVSGVEWGVDFFAVPLKLEHLYRYSGIWDPRYMNVFLSVAYKDLDKFWGILNVKYLTSKNPINVSGFRLIKKFDYCGNESCYHLGAFEKALGPYLYENQNFLPRAYVVNNAILVVGEENNALQAVYALMLDSNFDPKTTVLIRGREQISDYSIEELKKYAAVFLTAGSVDANSQFILKQFVDSGGILLPDLVKGENTVTEERIGEMWLSMAGDLNPIPDDDVIMHNFDKREIKLHKKYKGFLVYSEKFTMFPGWVAKSYNGAVEILNADAVISSVYLGGSEDSIIFEYRPKSYRLGTLITLMAIILLVGLFIYNKLKDKNDIKG